MTDAPTPPALCPECRAEIFMRFGGAWCPRCQGYLDKIETRSYDHPVGASPSSQPTTVLTWRVVRRYA